jgi:ribonuclease Z
LWPAQDVDVLFHEGIQVTMTRVMGEAAAAANRPNIATILADIEDYHATPEDAARAASDANAGQLVFYHMIPPLPSSLLYPVFLGDAAEVYAGPIRIAEDGMLVSLPADSESVDFSDAVR